MNLPDDTIFHWRSNGPNLWIGAIVAMAIIGWGYLWCRTSKGRVVGIAVSSVLALYAVFVFAASKVWPDEVSISMEEIHGRHDLSKFSLNSADIRSIRGSQTQKGGYHLHVFLKSSDRGVEIPVIWDHDKELYQNALHKLCPDAKLDW